MRWLMEACPDSLGWQAWLVLCSVVVVLWAVAIAAAMALFQASGQSRAARRADDVNQSVNSGPSKLD